MQPSQEYYDLIDSYKVLHEEEGKFKGISLTPLVPTLIHVTKENNCKTLLDYGCGKGALRSRLDLRWIGYDPHVEKFNVEPEPQNFVMCFDVLEHIEQEFLSNVLNHIDTLAQNFVWLRIDTAPARKSLSDGRNAHLSLYPKEWWEIQVQQHIKGKIIYTGFKKGKFDIALQKDKI